MQMYIASHNDFRRNAIQVAFDVKHGGDGSDASMREIMEVL